MPIQKEKRQRLAPNTPSTSSSSSTNTSMEGWPNSVNSRAERSRHAAKMRRDRETEEISALSKLLPYPEEVIRRLDKGSIIRLTTSYLRMKKFSQREGTALLDELKKKAICSAPEKSPDQPNVNEGALMLQALNGFVLYISRKGVILYVSENVGKQIGIHQYDMIGNNIREFIHPDDQKELGKQFVVHFPGHQSYKGYGMENPDDSPTVMNVDFFDEPMRTEEKPEVTDYIQDRHFFLRMKSVVSRRSMGGKGKVVGYRVVNLSGRLKLKGSTSSSRGYNVEGLICLCRPIQPQPILEIRMDGNMFMSRHGLDMSFTFCDPRIITLVGYEPHEVIGKTAYQFHNPLDARKVSDCHSNLIVKGSSMSKYYRFLGKLGEWVWMQTKATIIYNTNNVAQYVVCMNYVIGKDEGERHLLMEQMQQSFQGALMSDSDSCGSPSTPGTPNTPSTPGTPGTPSTSGMGSCSELDELCSPKIIELKDEELADLVPQSVRENQVILKPEDKSSDKSFKELVQEAKKESAPKDLSLNITPVVVEEATAQCDDVDMETDEIKEEAECSMDATACEETVENNIQDEQSDTLCKPDSPASDAGSLGSSDSGSIPSPPSREQQKRMGSIGTDDEQELLTLLDIPCTEESEFSRISTLTFTVPSPDNLSQIINSPAGTTASFCPDKDMSWLDEDLNDMFQEKLKSPASNILLELLNQPSISEKPCKLDSPCNESVKQPSTSSGKPTDNMRTLSGLPSDLADFSLEYESKCPQMDDSASSVGNISLADCLPTENSEGDLMSDIVKPQISETSSSQSQCPSSSVVVDHLTVTSQYSDVTAVATHLVTCNGKPIPPVSNCSQAQAPICDSQVVTEGMSKLDIQGRMHSMLKALLTGAEKNPLSTHARHIPQPLRPPQRSAMDNINDLLGPITPSTKAAVETLDSLMQDHVNSGRDMSINNNHMNVDDLSLMQRHQQRMEVLERHYLQEEQELRERHRLRQLLLEEQHKQELVQRQSLHQQEMGKMQPKLVNGSRIPTNGMHQNGLTLGTNGQSRLQHIALPEQNGLPLTNGVAHQNGVSEQNGFLLGGQCESNVDIAGLNTFDFPQQLNAPLDPPQQAQQQSHFQVNGTFSPSQGYQIPTQHENGFLRQPAPYQQGSPPILGHGSPPNNLHSSQTSLLAACLLGQSASTSQGTQQPIQPSLPASFQPNSDPLLEFSSQSTPLPSTSSTLPPSEWQSLGSPGRGFVNGTSSTPDHTFQEPCVLQQPLHF